MVKYCSIMFMFCNLLSQDIKVDVQRIAALHYAASTASPRYKTQRYA